MDNNELDIKKYVALIRAKKRLCIAVALAVMTLAIIISYVLPRKYEAKSVVFIEKSVIAELIKGIAVAPSIEDKVKVLTYAITSRTLLEKVIDELDMNLKKGGEIGREALVKEIQQNLQVRQKDKESLFTIIYSDKDPKIARDFVNVLVRRYIEENTSSKREDTYGASQFLSEQMGNFKEKLDKAEAAVQEYKRSRGAVVGIDSGTLQREIETAQNRLDEVRIKKTQLESRLVAIRKESPLLSKINQLKKRQSELKIQYTDNYPEVVQIRGEIETLQAQIKSSGNSDHPEDTTELDRISAEIRVLKQAEDNLRSSIASNRNLLRTIPSVQAELQELERERNTQKELYDQLVNRHGQSEVSRQMEVQDKSTNFRIVDPAVLPMKPVSPNRLRIMLMGMAAGLGGALALVILLDTLDSSVKSQEMAKQFGCPVLAIIPALENPVATANERKKDRILYFISICYFCFLLSFVAMELLGIEIIDKLLNRVLG